GLAPAPAAQLFPRCSLQALTEQRAGGNAVWTAVNFEAQRHDAIVAHSRAEIEAHTLRRISRGCRDDVGVGRVTADVARPAEMLDDQGAVLRFAHDFFSELAVELACWG